MTTLKKYFSCQQSVTPNTFQGTFYFDLSPYFAPGWFCQYVNAPTGGFTELRDTNLNLIGYTCIGVPAGVYEVEIFAGEYGSTDYTYFILEFEFSSTCATEQNICCKTDSATIRWLGREGGIKQWNFPGVYEFDIRAGDALTFKNKDRQLQYSERKNVYQGKRISTGSVTKDQVKFLGELKTSIQAWEVIDDVAIAITLDNGGFIQFKSTDNFYDFSAQYVVAEQVNIQTQ